VAPVSSVLFFVELRHLLFDGSLEYFNDSFKYLDLVTFAMQIIVDALFVTRSHFMRPACAFNILLFFFKILTFTRGFDTWGPLVRMIMKVLQEVREFIVVIMISIAGFGMAINVALGDDYDQHELFDTPLKAMYWITKTGLYQHDSSEHEANSSDYPDGILLFEIMMFFIALILLNLLIAIMNSAYEEVKVKAKLEVLYQKANIISSMEKLWLPILIQWGYLDARSLTTLYPKWLHMLVPLTTHQQELIAHARRKRSTPA
jgi:hypothetical protein